MGYEIATDGDGFYYQNIYRKWTTNFTIPTIQNEDLALRVIKSASVLKQDLIHRDSPFWENSDFVYLLFMIEELELYEKGYTESLNPNSDFSLNQDSLRASGLMLNMLSII